jgi:hypothetical protein
VLHPGGGRPCGRGRGTAVGAILVIAPGANTRFAPTRPVAPGDEGGGVGGVEVLLGNGRRVRVEAGFDAGVLARVVSVLEGLTC